RPHHPGRRGGPPRRHVVADRGGSRLSPPPPPGNFGGGGASPTSSDPAGLARTGASSHVAAPSSPRAGPPAPQRVHLDRAAGRHRHHRRADRPPAARRPEGPGGG